MKKFSMISLCILLAGSFSLTANCQIVDKPVTQTKFTNFSATMASSEIIKLEQWRSVVNDGTNFVYTNNVSCPQITQDVIDKGLVMIYWQDKTTWYGLPFSDARTGYSDHINFILSAGNVLVKYSGYNNSAVPNIKALNGQGIRIIIMQPTNDK